MSKIVRQRRKVDLIVSRVPDEYARHVEWDVRTSGIAVPRSRRSVSRRTFAKVAGLGAAALALPTAALSLGCNEEGGGAISSLLEMLVDSDNFNVFGGGDSGVTGNALFRILDPAGLLVRLFADLFQGGSASGAGMMVDGVEGEAEIPEGTHMVTHPMLNPMTAGMHYTQGTALGEMRRSGTFTVS